MYSSVVLVALLLLSSTPILGRAVDGVESLEKSLESGHTLTKREAFDVSCKGIYDRELIKKLDRVCDDCYNLYRKPKVAIGCRKNCFGSSIFRQCVAAQMLDVEEHVDMRDSLAFI